MNRLPDAASLLWIPALIILYWVCMMGFRVPHGTWMIYLILSPVTFIVYAIDKYAAKNDHRRIPEINLHILALLGGWPGALLAQHMIRHKSAKQAFRRIFWVTVMANMGALVAVSVWLSHPTP